MRRTAGFVVPLVALVLTCLPTPARSEALTLRQCLARVVAHNPQLAEARLGVEAGEHSVQSAWGRHLPRLSVDAGYTRREDPTPFIPATSPTSPAHFSDEYASWSGLLTLPLYQGGQISTNVELARVRRDLQAQNLAQTRSELLANTINAYDKLLQLAQFREAIRLSTSALEEQVKNARLLLDVERIARVDYLKVEVQLANEQQRLLVLDEGISTAAATLRYLMGDSPGAEAPNLELADSLAMPDSSSMPGPSGEDAWTRRPEYKAAASGVREAQLNHRNALGKLLPSLNALGGYTRQFGFRPTYDAGNWFVGVQAGIPLFDRSLYADVGRDQALQRKAKERLRSVGNQLGLELANSLTSIRESAHRVQTAQQVIEQARESFRIEQLKYGSGAGTASDLLLAQAAASAAEANLSQALFDYNAALVSYHKATGTMEEYLK
jgi:outer membrane protein TolC